MKKKKEDINFECVECGQILTHGKDDEQCPFCNIDDPYHTNPRNEPTEEQELLMYLGFLGGIKKRLCDIENEIGGYHGDVCVGFPEMLKAMLVCVEHEINDFHRHSLELNKRNG